MLNNEEEDQQRREDQEFLETSTSDRASTNEFRSRLSASSTKIPMFEEDDKTMTNPENEQNNLLISGFSIFLFLENQKNQKINFFEKKKKKQWITPKQQMQGIILMMMNAPFF